MPISGSATSNTGALIMGKFNAACCDQTSRPFSSGTLTGVPFAVPAGARTVTLIIHSSGGIAVSGEVNATFSWAGSSRSWDARQVYGTDGKFASAFTFTPAVATAVYEVDYIL
jgi:hypothetical protein